MSARRRAVYSVVSLSLALGVAACGGPTLAPMSEDEAVAELQGLAAIPDRTATMGETARIDYLTDVADTICSFWEDGKADGREPKWSRLAAELWMTLKDVEIVTDEAHMADETKIVEVATRWRCPEWIEDFENSDVHS